MILICCAAEKNESEAEVKQGEQDAAANVRNFGVGCLVLYFGTVCSYQPALDVSDMPS